MQEHFEKKLSKTHNDYELLFAETNDKRIREEKKTIEKHGENEFKRILLSNEITNVREKYSELEHDLLNEKSRVLSIVEEQYQKDMDNFAKNYEHDVEMNLIWNLKVPVFEINVGY
jgi:hypothetical protein